MWWKYFFTGNFNVIRYTIARFFSLIISLIVASLVIFSVIEVIPGDPASFMLGINAREDTLAALRSEMGLDQPLTLRYFDWVIGMFQGDFGNSWIIRPQCLSLSLTAFGFLFHSLFMH